MAHSPLRSGRAVQAATILGRIWAVVFSALVIYSIVQFRSWTMRLEIIAFFAGFGGAALMFYRWRRHGDRLAKVLCLAAFGTWGLAVVISGVGNAPGVKPGSVGFDVGAAALLIGFLGGVIVSIRMYVRRDGASSPPPQ